MGRALTIFFGLLAFGLLVLFCLGHEEHIQKEVAANARMALASGGYDFARATASGQTVTLRGTAENAAERDAAERAVLAAPGVVDVDNQIALLTVVPPPGPDSRPMLLEPPTPVFDDLEDEVTQREPANLEDPDGQQEQRLQAATATDNAEVAPDPQATGFEPAPVDVIPESLQIELWRLSKRAKVSGRTLSAAVDEQREGQLAQALQSALPGWQVSSSLAATANVATDLLVAVQQVVPALTVAEAAQINVDAQGIKVDARLTRFADRAALQGTLERLAGRTNLKNSNLSWMLDSPPPSEDSCQQAFDDLLGKDSIMFTISKAEIRPGSLGLLDKLVVVARACEVTIEVEGHTDSRGPAEFNDYLSQARADSVRAYLIANGVDASRISARGFGSSRPIADNTTVNGRQANRRIEFRVQRTDS